MTDPMDAAPQLRSLAARMDEISTYLDDPGARACPVTIGGWGWQCRAGVEIAGAL